MNVLLFMLPVSLLLAAAFVAAFVWDLRRGASEHHDRMSVLPFSDESPRAPRE